MTKLPKVLELEQDVKDWLKAKEYSVHIPIVSTVNRSYYKTNNDRVAAIVVGGGSVSVNLWDMEDKLLSKDNPTNVTYKIEDFGDSVHVIESVVNNWLAGGKVL